MKRVCISFLITTVFVILSAPLIAQTPVSTYTANSAFAWFSANDPSDPTGCTVIQGLVSPSSSFTATPGPPPKAPPASMYLFLAKYDFCNWGVYMMVQDYPTVTELSMNPASAHLRAEGNVYEQVSGSMQWVTVDVTWSPTSSQVHNSSIRSKSSQGVTLYRSRQTVYSADATGTIMFGGQNYIPLPTSNANFVMQSDFNLGNSR